MSDSHKTTDRSQHKPPAIWLVAAFLLLMAVVFGSLTAFMLLSPSVSGVMTPGNAPQNLLNGGALCPTPDSLFLRGPDGGLYRQKADGNGFDRMFEGDCSALNVVQDWIYYLDTGSIKAAPLYGLASQSIGQERSCTAMSVNGAWIYFTDTQGALYKMTVEGAKKQQLSALGDHLSTFTVNNRMIFYTLAEQDGLYIMQTDGKERRLLIDEPVTSFLYTADDTLLYTTGDGTIHRQYPVLSNATTGKPYTPVQAEIYNYQDQLLYYIHDNALWVLSLPNTISAQSKNEMLCSAPDAVSLYVGKNALYFYDAQDRLFSVPLKGGKPTQLIVGS